MINSPVAALQLLLIIISAAIILYALIIRGDNRKTTYMTFLLDLCLLWMVLI
jgi:hypothetical protein